MSAPRYSDGDRVLVTFTLTGDGEREEVTREGVVIDAQFEDDLTEVYVGTQAEWDALYEEEGIYAHDQTGVYYDDQLAPAP